MRKLLALILCVLLFAELTFTSRALAECVNSICVDVTSDPANNQIIITAHKPGSTYSQSPRPRPSRTALRKPWIPWLPRTTSPTPRPKRTYKRISTADLADRFTQLVPRGAIHVQPKEPLLTQVPVNFWSEVPNEFTFTTVLLGVAVKVDLAPSFSWSFGDGAADSITGRGAPYPFGTVRHRFTAAGEKEITLSISWSGKAWIDGIPAPIPGGLIMQKSQTRIRIVPAHTQIRR